MNLDNTRNIAAEKFKSTGYPSVKDESWRFTDLSLFKTLNFNGAWKQSDLPYESISDITMVFENGKLSDTKSNTHNLPNGISLKSINDHNSKNFGSLIDDNSSFALYNTANFTDGYYLKINDNIKSDKVIHIIYLADSEMLSCNVRNLIEVDNNSSITIIEEYIGSLNSTYFTNALTEVIVKDNAEVDHYKIQNESSKAYHFQTLEANVSKTSCFKNHTITLGGLLNRNDIRGTLLDQNSNIICNGLYLLKDQQLFDTHLFMDHAAPSCNSHELYKGILADKSRGVFCGRILVQQDAQQTDAIQSNANLLLSRSAKVNSMPQLEIYADDVKCTHGATIGELDEAALFYMKTRGIDPFNANALLTFAFANEVLDEIDNKSIKQRLEFMIHKWLGEVLS
ncbi:MAG: Fe-S cluster assembly protein SufD [Pontiellaceae bacterium]